MFEILEAGKRLIIVCDMLTSKALHDHGHTREQMLIHHRQIGPAVLT